MQNIGIWYHGIAELGHDPIAQLDKRVRGPMRLRRWVLGRSSI